MTRESGNYLYDIPPARLARATNWRKAVKWACATVAAFAVVVVFGWRLLLGAW